MSKDYSRLKELLDQQETFPLDFPIRFIGRNSAAFRRDVRTLELRFAGLRDRSERQSAHGAHLAISFVLRAATSQEVIEAMEAIHQIEDVAVVL